MSDSNTSETASGDKHEDQIRADRACIGCGFNLFGQSVTREPHYNLAIARCPECGVVAALQTYPLMTHWANRFRLIIGGLWVTLLLGAFALTVLLFIGFINGVNATAADRLAGIIGMDHERWVAMRADADPAAASTVTTATTLYPAGNYQWVNLLPEWVETRYPQVLSESGGRLSNMDWDFVFVALPAMVLALLSGILWSTALLGARRRWVCAIPVASALIALAITLAISRADSYVIYATTLARREYYFIIAPALAGSMVLAMALGIAIGRTIARWVIVLALPPRARVPFAVLWTRDGLSPPRPGFK